MNRAVLMGRLTRDPEVRYFQEKRSMAVTRYTLAMDRRGRKGQDSSAEWQTADFINCVVLGHTVGFAEKYFYQGMWVLVSGRIQTSSYINREDQKAYTTEVILNDQGFADSKGASSGGNQPRNRPTSDSPLRDGFMNTPDRVEDDGLPFN